MGQFKKLMIEALKEGKLEAVRHLKPEFSAEMAREAWLNKYIIDGKGSIPIAEWILGDNPFITFE